jgi:hypothetical protein
MIRTLVMTIVVASCSKAGSSAPEAEDDPCTPAALGLPSSKPAAIFELPAGCTFAGTKTWIASVEDAREAFDCEPDALGVDFASEAIIVSSGTLSPAQTGSWALDDGIKITMVSRFRDPCPDDPQPMPTPFTATFRVPAGARTFSDVSCTVKTKCR